MTIELTEVPAEQGPQQDPRDSLMHAFAVAETVVSQLSDRPTTVTLNDNMEGAYGVVLYFHHQPDHVRHFAAQFDVVASSQPHVTDTADTYTSAECSVDGVQVRAWALVRGEQVPA